MSYLNSITLVGFVGPDPEQRQTKGNGSKFTVLSVATQRSRKNADDEWSSKTAWHRVVVFRPLLAERVATTIKKGGQVLVEGSLVSSTYEQPNGKGKKSKTSKSTSWSVRAEVVRRLDRGEPEPNAPAPGQAPEHQRDGSATIQAQIHHRQALLAPHRSVGFLGAYAANCAEFAAGDARDRCRPLQESRSPRGGELHRRTSPASLDFAAAPAYRPEECSATLPRLESTEAGDAVGLGPARL
jgi:single stranded DNA-binding protein